MYYENNYYNLPATMPIILLLFKEPTTLYFFQRRFYYAILGFQGYCIVLAGECRDSILSVYLQHSYPEEVLVEGVFF